ncbi:MAG: Solute-binding protein [Paracidovorax wautersii]|uniref:Solute-binding protein n=1 Tax=Paracidovorax wautersii TaxID=1177982 RepID=A0A7V8FQW4_9BURK|nr:MAG: Solute-binding protein [Paracidovorax wautersii]
MAVMAGVRLRAWLGGVAAACSLAAGGQALAQTEVKIGYALATTSHYGAAAQAWGDSVEKATAGRYKFKQFPASALGGERESIEGLQLGTVQALIVSTGTLSNFVPEVGVVDVPFLFRDTGHARRVMDGPIGQDLMKKFQPRGIVALAWGEQGFRHLTNNKHGVVRPEDFKGLKIRTMENPVHITAFKTLGAAPTPMAWPEVIGALQQGTIDGQENPLSVIVSAKVSDVQKYLTLSSHVYAPALLIVSPRFWNKLSDADKAAFVEGAKAGVVAMRAYVDDVDAKGVATLKAAGMQVNTIADKTPFQHALAPAYAQYQAKFGKELLDRIAAAQ